jgi:hypothetical protein
MVKYCIKCGKENDDQAVFCTDCGARFPDQTAAPAAPQAPTLLTASMEAGVHKHMLTDVSLRDTSGKAVLVARRTSILHEDFDIVDGNGTTIGYIQPKTHLTHRTLSFQDANHGAQGAVQVSSFEQRGVPPNCWLEDAGGGRLASIIFTNGFFGFSGVKSDGSRIFDAAFSGGAGVRQALSAASARAYSIQLLDLGFPLPALLTVIAALDHASLP